MSLYRKRQDKSWSLMDCISFTVMEQCAIKSVLTGDPVHYPREGQGKCGNALARMLLSRDSHGTRPSSW
jgi:hypothetical protein